MISSSIYRLMLNRCNIPSMIDRYFPPNPFAILCLLILMIHSCALPSFSTLPNKKSRLCFKTSSCIDSTPITESLQRKISDASIKSLTDYTKPSRYPPLYSSPLLPDSNCIGFQVPQPRNRLPSNARAMPSSPPNSNHNIQRRLLSYS